MAAKNSAFFHYKYFILLLQITFLNILFSNKKSYFKLEQCYNVAVFTQINTSLVSKNVFFKNKETLQNTNF